MCTGIALTSEAGTSYLGRNLDFGFPTDPHLVSVPAGARWTSVADGGAVTDRLAFIGLGQFGTGYPVFLDGVNEAGLAGAALYYPGYAAFADPKAPTSLRRVDALDLPRVLLGSCRTLDEVREAMEAIEVVGIPNSVTHQVAPLHWLFADTSGSSLVIEVQEDGCHVMDNPVGVLTNSPDFSWHLTNLRNFIPATATQPATVRWSELSLSPFGQGAGCSGLPGGYAPPERFVRAAFMRANVEVPADDGQAVAACFHALEPCAVPLGSAVDPHGRDYTQYSAVINVAEKTYFFRTYENPVVHQGSLADLLAADLAPDATGARDHGSIMRKADYPKF